MGRKLLCIVLIYPLLVAACATSSGPSASSRTEVVARGAVDTCVGWGRCATEACSVDLSTCYLAKHLAQAVKAFPLEEHPGPMKVVATAPFYDAVVAERLQAIARRILLVGDDPALIAEVNKLIPQLIPSWLPSIQAAVATRLHREFVEMGIELREAQLNEILAEQQLWRHPDFQNFLQQRVKQLRGATFVVLGKASPPERKFSRVNATVVYVVDGTVKAAPEVKIVVAKPCVWCWILGVAGVLAAGAIAAISIGGGGNDNKTGNVQVTVPPLR